MDQLEADDVHVSDDVQRYDRDPPPSLARGLRPTADCATQHATATGGG